MTHVIRRLPMLALAGVLLAPGCGTDDAGPRSVVSDSAGVEVVTYIEMPSLDDPDWRWRIERTRSIPTASERADERPLIYDPQAMVRLDDGTLVVSDVSEPHVIVIDAEADSVISRFGATGSGPGEIRYASPWPGPDGTIWVADARNTRTTRYTLDGEVLSSARWQFDARGSGIAMTSRTAIGTVAHRFWVTDFAENTLLDSLAWIDPRTGEMDNFVELPREYEDRSGTRSFHGERTAWTALPDGGVVVMRTYTPAIRYFSSDGELVREIRLPLTPRPISELEGRQAEDDMRSLARGRRPVPETDIGERYPITTRLYAVDDSTFAMYQSDMIRAVEDPPLPDGRTVWRLITVSGRYAGAIHYPRRFVPRWADDGYVLGVARDSLDLATIEEYALAPPMPGG